MDIDEISTRPETGTQGGGLADEAKQAAQDAKAAVAREMDEAKSRAAGAARQIKDGARNAGDRVAALPAGSAGSAGPASAAGSEQEGEERGR